MSGDFSDPSLSGLIYTIEPDVMPLAIQTVGSDWLYTGDNLGLMYRDGEYSLVGGSWISANSFSVKETVPFASGGSSAWTLSDVSTLLSRLNTTNSYLMGNTAYSFTTWHASGGTYSTFTSSSLGQMLSSATNYITSNQKDIYNRFSALMGSSGSVSFDLYGLNGSVSSTSATSLAGILGPFATSSTRLQGVIADRLMGTGSATLSLSRIGLGTLTLTPTDLGTLFASFANASTLNQSALYSVLMGSSGSVSASIYNHGSSEVITSSYSSLGSLFSAFISSYGMNTTIGPNNPFLGSDGLSFSHSVRLGSTAIMTSGFQGLATILRGSSGSVISATNWSFDSDLNKSSNSVRFSNVLQALASIQSSLQHPLSQLQAVLANDDDLELRQRTQAQVEQVTSDFTGDGAAAPSLSDISDMASFSGQMSSLFSSGSSVGDFFTAAGSADAYQFFSQAVADDLDSTSSVAALSVIDDSDPFDGFVLGDDGFYSLADTSLFDLSAFRERGE